ncbi:MAG: SpaH/EbpB family LPXTG-anchored major pilin, partial [Ruminococcus sp.]
LVVITLLSTFSITAFAAETEIAKFHLTKGEEFYYESDWGYTAHKLTVSRSGYSDKLAYCIDADLPAPPTGDYHITTGTRDLADTMGSKRYKNMCKALYYCYGGEGFSKNIGVYPQERHRKYNGEWWYSDKPGSMNDVFGNIRYAEWDAPIGASGESLCSLLTHRVLAYLSGMSTWDYNLPTYGPSGSSYSYWQLAVQEVCEAIEAAPDIPLYSSIYLCSFGSSYQRLLIPFDGITLQIKKSSANPEMTNGNSCYSLEGAVYNVYSDKSCTNYVGNITTNANGTGYLKDNNGNARIVPKQTYYVKESKAPKGYALDKTVYSFPTTGYTYNNHIVCEISCKDVPLNDPVVLGLYKEDAVTHERTKALAGAEFTVKYYDGYYNTPAEAKTATPARSWVIKTDEYGIAQLDKDYLVSGDEFYYITGNPDPVLPLGTVTIEETKAPDGYKITEEVYLGQVVAGTYGMKWITGNITEDNNILVEEQQSNGYIGVHKVNQDNEPVEGAVYGLYTSSEADSNGMLLESNRVATITTDVNGNGTFDYASPVGTTVYVQEITAPVGYELDRKVYETSPSAENVEITNPAIVNVVENVVTGSLKVVKTSDDGIVDNFWFSITDSNGKTYDNIRTQNGGIAELKNLPVYNKDNSLISYTVDELGLKQTDGTYSLPARYNKPVAVTQTLVENDTVTFGFNNAVKVGNLWISKRSDDGIVEGFSFSVKGNNGYSTVLTTDENGYATVNNLPVYNYSDSKITYTVEELGVKNSDGTYTFPTRYKKQEAVSFELTENDTYTYNCYNKVRYGNLEIDKLSQDGIVNGLCFEVSGSDGYSTVVTMDDSGKAIISDLPVYDTDNNLITYTVKELGVKNSDGTYTFPERYIPTSKQTRTLTEDATVKYTFRNVLKKADMMIKKTSEDNIVKDIAFSVKSDYKDYGTFTTDENGVINVKNLPVYDSDNNKITYQIRELGELQSDGTYKLPFRYNEPQNQTATLEYGKTTTVNFTNTLKTGSVTINKQDGWGNPLSGVEFELYKNDGTKLILCENTTGSYSVSSDGTITALTTDENGKIIVGELAQGDYYLVEVKSSSGTMPYTERIEFSIVAEDETTLNPEISVKDNKIIMYNTGGFGDTGLYILAAVIFTAALGLLIVFFKNKRKSGKEKNKMNKKSHRILSVFIAVMILLISSIPFVGAAETQTALDTGTKVSFTLNCEKKGYTFQVYQVGKLTTSKNPYETKYESLVPEIADSVLNGNTADMLSALDEIEAMPSEAISKGIFVSSATTKTRTFRNLEQGIYYVRATNYPAGVKSVTNSVFALPYYNNESGWIYEIPAINLAEKVNDDIPETHKSITNSTQNNENFTDVSLGDTVSFQIKSSTAGSNQMKLNAYTVSDDMNKGLTLDKNSFNVSLLDDEGKKISDLAKSDYTVDITNEKEGENTLFSVVLSKDYLQKADFYSAAYTSITYNANLNKYASVGFAGNPNKLTALSYTNKNGVTAEIEGNIVYVYTWSIYVDKFNEKGEVLNGAEFSLYKTKEDVNCGKALGNGISDEKGKVYFYNSDNEEIRLQSGKYYIKETKAPTGYNLYTDVIEISIDVTYGDTFVNDTYVTGGPGDGYASVEVKNTQTILPQTGGNGAIILYVLSGISLAGAITLFVVRRKIKN